MDKGSQTSLQIMRLPQGGYVVADGMVPGDDSFRGMARQFHFACTDIDAALNFIRQMVVPIPPTTPPWVK